MIRVLVVEDEVITRAAVAEKLRETGLTVVEAANDAEADSYLERGEAVDLVLRDVHVPNDDD
jgi:CheY-like chemotaxis protein